VEIDVIFNQPETMDEREAYLKIESNNPPCLVDMAYLCDIVTFQTKTPPIPDFDPRIKVSPKKVDFGSVSYNEESMSVLTIQNIGSTTLEMTEIEFVGSSTFAIMIDGVEYKPGDAIDFSAAPIEIPKGQLKAYSVYFRPETPGTSTASLNVFSNDPTAPPGGVEVILKGTANGPCISAKPSVLHFGGNTVDQLSILPLKIQSCGSAPLVISGIAFQDNSSADFSLDFESLGAYGVDANTGPTANTPLTIPSGEEIELSVRFLPKSASPKDENGQAIPEMATIMILNNTLEPELSVMVEGAGIDSSCPMPVIGVQEGEMVSPQTMLHLFGDQSYSSAGTIQKWAWSVQQPEGSQALFTPSANFPAPTLEVNVAGSYLIQLNVWDEDNTKSCAAAQAMILVIPQQAIHVELLWDTPNDPDQTNEGPEAGADMDLHFTHAFAGGPDLDGDGEPDGWFDQPFDCFWFNPHPMWGSFDPSVDDDPGLDRDDTDGAGPENLNLNLPENNKSYRVGVHYWHDHGFGTSYATVRIYIYSQLIYEASGIEMSNLDFWEVGTIHWPTGNFEPDCDPDSSGNDCAPDIIEDYANPFFSQP
jgi:hypothetical protein